MAPTISALIGENQMQGFSLCPKPGEVTSLFPGWSVVKGTGLRGYPLSYSQGDHCFKGRKKWQ